MLETFITCLAIGLVVLSSLQTFSHSTDCHVHEWWNALCSNWISFGPKATYVSINRKKHTKTT